MSEQVKVALITGANKGIGFETARQLGQQGILVLVGARDLAKGEAAATELKDAGVHARAVKLEVNSPADYGVVAAMIQKEFGKLDILINNAAIFNDNRKANETSTTSAEALRETFDTNFFGTVALTQALLPLLRKSDAGRIVNLSSVLGSNTLHTTPGSQVYEAKSFAYDASKAALNSFTIHLAHELKGTKIKVNSAHPGWVKTEMGGDGASMEIEEGAKTSVELATLPEDGPTSGYFHLGKSLPG